MATGEHSIELGFAGGTYPAGTHICQIITDDAEQDEALRSYLLAGMEAGERCACFSESLSREQLGGFLADHDISLEEQLGSGELTLHGTSDVYFAEDRFDPERMLALLRHFYEDAIAAGRPAARVIGEMTSQVMEVPGSERLLEYEARITMLLRECPVTSVCQYDAREFDGKTIMDILKVHPMMVVRGEVVHNPFYIPPEEYLAT